MKDATAIIGVKLAGKPMNRLNSRQIINNPADLKNSITS